MLCPLIQPHQVDGVESIQRGWLTEEVLVQLKVQGGGLDLWRRKEAGGRVFAKLTALPRREEGEESLDMAELREAGGFGSWPIVEAAVSGKWQKLSQSVNPGPG